MNILLIGSGGREHAMAYAIAKSKLCSHLYIAPGNAGTNSVGENIALDQLNFNQIGSFCKEHHIGLIVVGPEEPLVKGLRDFFESDADLSKIPFIGSGKNGAQLEGSKDFSKRFMQAHGIPTAAYQSFTSTQIDEALTYIQTCQLPIVLKADGLAAGKGVLICETHAQAIEELKEMLLNQKFGSAGNKVVIEEFLKGIELSVFVLTDGEKYCILPEAKDYKRIGEGDTGLNTGGMGAVSPVPFADDAFMQKVENRIVRPTISGLQKEGIPYCGFIFIGLMKCNDDPYVIEYNCRMGDPETEVVFPRIESDVVDMLLAAANKTLDQHQLHISKKSAATVMLVSEGYPGNYEKGKKITLPAPTHSLVFHAGTKLQDNEIVTNGGRVLSVTTLANSITEAVNESISVAYQIDFEGKYFRRDIGYEFKNT
jgi:phosphoribosylamine--glycine ligase